MKPFNNRTSAFIGSSNEEVLSLRAISCQASKYPLVNTIVEAVRKKCMLIYKIDIL